MTQAKPITEPDYWNALWRGQAALRPIDPHKGGLRNYAYRQLHQAFQQLLIPEQPRDKEFIELGCGGSRWLGYFQQTYGCKISGMDYSPQGCAMTQDLLQRMHVAADIMQGDISNPPTDHLKKYDFVFSNGLIEHFADTAAAVRACAAFLKPGGLMITLVPNMTGPLGGLQRAFDRNLYEKHVPLSVEDLARAHEAAGLRITASAYLLLAHLGVLQFGGVERLIGARLLQVVKIALSAPLWAAGPLFGLRPNSWTSPFILCAARKPV